MDFNGFWWIRMDSKNSGNGFWWILVDFGGFWWNFLTQTLELKA